MPSPQSENRVVIYTDGACKPNPGPGGWAAIVLSEAGRTQLAGGFRHTTNNRMEIFAAIAGLRSLQAPTGVIVYSDSLYLVKAISKGWVRKWESQSWMRGANEPALNADLWRELKSLCDLHTVEFRWIRGHGSNEHNRQCDRLAGIASRANGLPVDSVYESELSAGRPRGQWSGNPKSRGRKPSKASPEMSALDRTLESEREALRQRVLEQMTGRKHEKSRGRRPGEPVQVECLRTSQESFRCRALRVRRLTPTDSNADITSPAG